MGLQSEMVTSTEGQITEEIGGFAICGLTSIDGPAAFARFVYTITGHIFTCTVE